MSQENVDLVRSIFVAWERGDFGETDWADRTGRGKASGMDLREMRTGGANVLHVRNGRVTKMVIYFHRDRALAELGLEEQAVSQENVEVAKRAMDVYNTDAALSEYDTLVTPDFEWTTAMAGVEDEVMRGREGVEGYYASLDAAWESVARVWRGVPRSR